MSKQFSILSTKTLSQKQRNLFDCSHFDVTEIDFIETKTLEIPSNIKIEKNIILTSKNSVFSLKKNKIDIFNKDYNFFIVGKKTAAAVENENGKINIIAKNGMLLSEIIINEYKERKFTFFSSSIRMDDLPQNLLENKIKFNEQHAYKTTLKPKKIKVNYDLILFFSPSGVESYMELNTINKEVLVCIGPSTGKKLKKLNPVIAPNASIEETIETAINYFKTESKQKT